MKTESEMKVSIILVNFNGYEYNEACIESVLKSDWRGTIDLYIVDNCSTDYSMEKLERRWGGESKFHFIRMKDNMGFSIANNVGIEAALADGTDYIMLLNNDTYIEPDMVAKMVEIERKYKNCIVLPKIYYMDRPEIIGSAGGELTRIVKKPLNYGENEKDSEKYSVERKCSSGNGCCFLLSEETFKKVGFLEETYFLYYEDTEFFMRAQENGVLIVYTPEAKMYHKGNGSTKGNVNPANVYYITRNWMMCHKKHLGKIRYVIFWVYFMLNRSAWILIWCSTGKRNQVKAVYQGIQDFYKKKGGKYVAQ